MCLHYIKFYPRKRRKLHSNVLGRRIGRARHKINAGLTKKVLLSDTNKNY